MICPPNCAHTEELRAAFETGISTAAKTKSSKGRTRKHGAREEDQILDYLHGQAPFLPDQPKI